MKKDTKKLVKTLKKQGWKVVVKRHITLLAPDGKGRVVMAASPSDVQRNMKNVVALLRRAGADV